MCTGLALVGSARVMLDIVRRVLPAVLAHQLEDLHLVSSLCTTSPCAA